MMQGEHVGYSVARLGDFKGIKNPDRPLYPTVPFTLLSNELFEPARWHPVLWGRWRFNEHITISESRTVVLLLRRIASFTDMHDSVVFTLQDNQPTAGSMSKGRSPSYPLNRILRQKAGICLAANLRVFLPWTESKKQPADLLSRTM
jgi:hypothetical protein